jgi:hypothetical protein
MQQKLLSDNLIGTEFAETIEREEKAGLKRRVAMILKLQSNPNNICHD